MKNYLIVLVALLTLGGCASVFEPGTIARDWSCKMRELQIQPVFPPREDMQVGDIYALAVPKIDTGECDSRTFLGMSFGSGGRGFVPLPVFLGALNLGDDLAKHYANRLDLPKTVPSQLSEGTDGKITINGYTTPEADNSLIPNEPQKTVLKRLRVVGFPDFMTVKVSSADIGLIFPMFGALASSGASANAVESASISIPVAESYAISAHEVVTGLNGKLTNSATAGKSCPMTYEGVMKLFPAKLLETHDVHIVGIYEVYYTRAIDSNISLKQEAVFGLNRDQEKSSPTSTTQGQPSGDTGGAKSAAGGAVAGGTPPAATTPIDVVRADLAKASTSATAILAKRNNLPGMTIDVKSGSAQHIGLTRVFERPVAIGFRAANFAMSSDKSGCIVLAQVPIGNGSTPAMVEQ